MGGKRLTAEDIKQRLIDGERPIVLVSYSNGILDTSSQWKCTECEHEWATGANNILNQCRGCPSCANRIPYTLETVRQKLIDTNRPIIILSYVSNMLNTSSQWKCTKCEHEWATSASTVLNKGCGCPACSNSIPWTSETISQRLIDDNHTVLLMWYGSNSHDNSSRWKCTVCEYEWATAAYSILSNGSGCPLCTNQAPLTPEMIGQRLVANNRPMLLLKYSGKAIDNSSLWKCTECEYEWNACANSILSGGTGCPSCANQVPLTPEIIKERLGDRPILLISHGKDTNDNLSLWKCTECERVWNSSSSNILNGGRGCPSCAVTGFDSGKPAHFYLHTFNGFIKIGITNRLEQRHRQLNNQIVNETRYTIENSMSWHFENGGDAAIVESMVLESFRSRQYTELLNTSFDGRTELLDASVFDEVVSILEEVNIG